MKYRLVADLLQLASTARARSIVTAAAVTFAVCHFAVLATAPTSVVIAGNFDGDIPRQLAYCAAVLCRFAVPLSVMIAGATIGRSKPKLDKRRAVTIDGKP